MTAAGSFDGYLYVDYLDNSGELVHMLPIPDHPDNAVSAAHTVTLGTDSTQEDGGPYQYRVTKPFGKAMIIAVQARQPLFPVLRPEVEAVKDYLPALRSALVDATTKPSATDVISAVQYIRIDPL